jgi:hypothetical protein
MVFTSLWQTMKDDNVLNVCILPILEAACWLKTKHIHVVYEC